jgi:hypothetical protein
MSVSIAFGRCTRLALALQSRIPGFAKYFLFKKGRPEGRGAKATRVEPIQDCPHHTTPGICGDIATAARGSPQHDELSVGIVLRGYLKL